MCHYQLFFCVGVTDLTDPVYLSGRILPPPARWSLEEGIPGVGEHVGPLVPVDGALRPLPDLDGFFYPTFMFVALRCDDACVVPVH